MRLECEPLSHLEVPLESLDACEGGGIIVQVLHLLQLYLGGKGCFLSVKGNLCLSNLMDLFYRVTCLGDKGGLINVLYKDVLWAFNIMLHQLYFQKMEVCGAILAWID